MSLTWFGIKYTWHDLPQITCNHLHKHMFPNCTHLSLSLSVHWTAHLPQCCRYFTCIPRYLGIWLIKQRGIYIFLWAGKIWKVTSERRVRSQLDAFLKCCWNFWGQGGSATVIIVPVYVYGGSKIMQMIAIILHPLCWIPYLYCW